MSKAALLDCPWVDSPSFPDSAPSALTADELELARQYRDKGYILLRDFVDPALIEEVIRQTRPLFDPAIEDGPRSRIRVQDVWDECSAVRRLATDARVLELLRKLYGRAPFPFQTLNFQYGTQQHAHQDRMFFDSLPAGFMCGVWVALEKVGPDNGTLFYYPGSHRLPAWSCDELGLPPVNLQREGELDLGPRRDAMEAALSEIVLRHGFEEEKLDAEPGTVLIWAAGLAHGGSPILRSGATRWSQVTHYFFDDCLYTTPVYSNAWAGDLYLRRVIDASTGDLRGHRYAGHTVEGVEHNGFYKLLVEDEGGATRVRAVPQTHVRDHQKILEMVTSSPSYRLGRALTAPLRLLRGKREP